MMLQARGGRDVVHHIIHLPQDVLRPLPHHVQDVTNLKHWLEAIKSQLIEGKTRLNPR